MPNSVGENQAKRKLAAGELVLCMGLNQIHTPNIAMIAAACGFDAIYIDLEQLGMRYLTGGSDVGYIFSAGRADVRRRYEVRLS
jgi:hypothetical protein